MFYRYVYAQNFINNNPSDYLNSDGSLKSGVTLSTTKTAEAGLPPDDTSYAPRDTYTIPVAQDIMYNGQKIGERRIVSEIGGISLAKILKITVNDIAYHRSAVFGITK